MFSWDERRAARDALQFAALEQLVLGETEHAVEEARRCRARIAAQLDTPAPFTFGSVELRAAATLARKLRSQILHFLRECLAICDFAPRLIFLALKLAQFVTTLALESKELELCLPSAHLALKRIRALPRSFVRC